MAGLAADFGFEVALAAMEEAASRGSLNTRTPRYELPASQASASPQTPSPALRAQGTRA